MVTVIRRFHFFLEFIRARLAKVPVIEGNLFTIRVYN
jgi:hypothetical protein